ncbi:MAG TPA: thiamine pyrophosphate-dependent enzyme [Terriglobales bacterium]|nr:thiamine pyrophosphate-dependent enzyme [Terriglobales bacterium]
MPSASDAPETTEAPATPEAATEAAPATAPETTTDASAAAGGETPDAPGAQARAPRRRRRRHRRPAGELRRPSNPPNPTNSAAQPVARQDSRPAAAAQNRAEMPLPRCDWQRVARVMLVSRELDRIEESELVPAKKVLYQFSARGHELGQVLLGTLLNRPHDAASGYYRSRPLLLTLGLSAADALAGGMAKTGSVSDGRDIGAVYNLPSRSGGPVVLPMAGGVGTQYTTTAGWARSIVYHRDQLGDSSYKGAVAVALGGEASVATNGFWSALTLATTLRLPMLFFIEDNGFGISVPSTQQTPGGNIAANLASFRNLRIFEGDGTDPAAALRTVSVGVAAIRAGEGPALVRLRVPRLSGHSGQDTQAYKSPELQAEERARDPLPKLKKFLVPGRVSESAWEALESAAAAEVAAAREEAERRPEPDPQTVRSFVFANERQPAEPIAAVIGARLNMVAAIRSTLEVELRRNPKLLVFGEDVGPKGGVHTATQGLHATFGGQRVFDTSLSEEGIIGSAVGLALGGLRPVAEIQFRKYAEPATEQLSDCGTLRWRTANRFSAPIVVRMPGGFFKCGDPWHSLSSEVTFVHSIGWQVLFPSNAADAVGLLRAALRSQNPSIFFEHRNLLDAASARRPYPGDDYVLPLGKANIVQRGSGLTAVTWGAMLERVIEASQAFPGAVEVLDLRTLVPWDREAVLESVRKTSRCLIVHEDTLTAGFGAEIAAVVAQEAFLSLDAPITRLAVPDVPMPYNVGLMEAVLPSPDDITATMRKLLEF